MSDRKSDWPLVVLILGVLTFVGTLVALGHPEALWGLFMLLAIFLL